MAAPAGPVEIPLRDRFAGDLATLPGKYAALAAALDGLPPGQGFLLVFGGSRPGGPTAGHSIPAMAQGTLAGGARFVGAQTVRLYLDPGMQLDFIVQRSPADGVGFATATFSGHFVNLQ